MNPKQTIPLAVSLAPLIAAAPAIAIGAAIGLAGLWLFKCLLDDSNDKQSDTAPAADPDASRKPVETPVFREIPAKPVIPSAPVSIPPAPRVSTPPTAIRPVSAIPAPVQPVVAAIKVATPATPPPIIKKSVTRADLAGIFDNGARTQTRTAAVTALKRLGFGKTAAYAALSAHGRFNAWLHCAPDGIITWKN